MYSNLFTTTARRTATTYCRNNLKWVASKKLPTQALLSSFTPGYSPLRNYTSHSITFGKSLPHTITSDYKPARLVPHSFSATAGTTMSSKAITQRVVTNNSRWNSTAINTINKSLDVNKHQHTHTPWRQPFTSLHHTKRLPHTINRSRFINRLPGLSIPLLLGTTTLVHDNQPVLTIPDLPDGLKPSSSSTPQPPEILDDSITLDLIDDGLSVSTAYEVNSLYQRFISCLRAIFPDNFLDTWKNVSTFTSFIIFYSITTVAAILLTSLGSFTGLYHFSTPFYYLLRFGVLPLAAFSSFFGLYIITQGSYLLMSYYHETAIVRDFIKTIQFLRSIYMAPIRLTFFILYKILDFVPLAPEPAN